MMAEKKETKGPEPMSGDLTERTEGFEGYTPTPRNVYALDTLLEEVTALFPETTHEIVGYARFGAGLDVQIDAHESPGLANLLGLIEIDLRIKEVLPDDESGHVLVQFWDAPPIMDNRDPFNLAEAWEVMTDGGLDVPQ